MKIKEIIFSQEELLYLLRALNLPDLPGMGNLPWGHIPQDQVLLIMETVGRGLVARQFARFGSAQMEIDKDISVLIRACTHPNKMLNLTYDQNGKTIHQNFFRGNGFDVEHAISYPWIHHFKVMPKSDLGLALVKSLLRDVTVGETSSVVSVQQNLLNEIRKLAVENAAAARQELLKIGLVAPLAEKFANALGAPKIKILLQAVYNLEEDVQQIVISLLADDAACWVISAGHPGSEIAQVMQVSPKKLNTIVLTTFQPFTQIP